MLPMRLKTEPIKTKRFPFNIIKLYLRDVHFEQL